MNPQSPSLDRGWQGVIDAVVPAIVALEVTAVRSFQDDHPGASGGTGFVVDAARGLLLTNRHVCTMGPERSSATFVGCPAMEEVPTTIAYVDPVHDFAILRFDPERLVQTPRAQIALEPTGLHVGEDIRVVGNDSLEKLQIFTGTIARVDRRPPSPDGDYHDENTFYALAGSGTRGGSSGSPVLNRRGNAVALNAAAANGTMHAFYLPLHRVARALEAVQKGEAVPRGTLCTALTYTCFPECIRLGVTSEFVKRLLAEPLGAGGTFSKSLPPGGMLEVKGCLPGSEASQVLRPGDVLLELNGKTCVDYVLFDAVLDSSVGGKVQLAVCRGGERVELELQVQDMHNLVPREFLEVGLGTFHRVPYQTGMKHNVPLEGVYVAQSGIVFGEAMNSDAVILELDGVPCKDLASFEAEVRRLPNKEYFSVTWMVPKSVKERSRTTASVKMQRHWWPSKVWTLEASTRSWRPRPLGATFSAPAASEGEAVAAQERAAAVAEAVPPAADAALPPPTKRARKSRAARVAPPPLLERSLCSVVFRTVQSFDLDLTLDAENAQSDVVCIHGAGVVIDSEAGLVLTDRATVPQPLGDIEVTLGEACTGASVWFVHPTHSLVILRVDVVPRAAGGERRFGQAAEFEDHDFEPGDECDFVGIDLRGQRSTSQVKIQNVRMGNFPVNFPPRWHESNLEAVLLETCPSSSNSGFLCSKGGRITGIYSMATLREGGEVSRMGYGVPARVALPLVARLREQPGEALPELRVPSLEVMLKSVELQKLRRLPPRARPSADWLARLAALGRGALQVAGITSKGPCSGLLAEGDLLVAISGEVVSSTMELEAQLWEAVETASASANGQAQHGGVVEVQLTLLRRGKEHTVQAPVALLGCDGVKRVVCWHGMLLQETPRCVREFGPVPAGVHIAQTLLGSPGEAGGIEGDFVVSVDGTPTPSLDAILAVEATHSQTASTGSKASPRRLRVESADMFRRHFLKTMEPDPLFWPTSELFQGSDGSWSCVERQVCGQAAAGSGSTV